MILLASQSPRRSELLRAAGIAFEVQPAHIEEKREAGEAPGDYVLRLSREKAQAVLALRMEAGENPLVLGADTVVTLDGEVLEKPRDAAEAKSMLRRLSGREHSVMTVVCLADRAGLDNRVSVTKVRFLSVGEEEIAAYVASGEPMDKAGAYGIQGHAAQWIPRIEGCYFNVVGLPLARVSKLLVG